MINSETNYMKKNGNGGETIIAEGVKVEGDFTSDGNVIIEGMVHGNVAAKGDVIVGTNAIIDADLSADNLMLSGKIKGNVRVAEKTDLAASSTLEGDLTTRVLNIVAGATVNGKIVMPNGTPTTQSDDEE